MSLGLAALLVFLWQSENRYLDGVRDVVLSVLVNKNDAAPLLSAKEIMVAARPTVELAESAKIADVEPRSELAERSEAGEPEAAPLADQSEAPAGESIPIIDEQHSYAETEALEEPEAVEVRVHTIVIDSKGAAILAGDAPPESAWTVLANGSPIGSVTADSLGKWKLLGEVPFTTGEHDFALVSESLQ
jgi:hypothetical protein